MASTETREAVDPRFATEEDAAVWAQNIFSGNLSAVEQRFLIEYRKELSSSWLKKSLPTMFLSMLGFRYLTPKLHPFFNVSGSVMIGVVAGFGLTDRQGIFHQKLKEIELPPDSDILKMVKYMENNKEPLFAGQRNRFEPHGYMKKVQREDDVPVIQESKDRKTDDPLEFPLFKNNNTDLSDNTDKEKPLSYAELRAANRKRSEHRDAPHYEDRMNEEQTVQRRGRRVNQYGDEIE